MKAANILAITIVLAVKRSVSHLNIYSFIVGIDNMYVGCMLHLTAALFGTYLNFKDLSKAFGVPGTLSSKLEYYQVVL